MQMCYEAKNTPLYIYYEVRLALSVGYAIECPTVALKIHVQIIALVLFLVASDEHCEWFTVLW